MLKQKIEACNACTLSRLMPDGMCVASVSTATKGLMLIGEALGADEADQRDYFVGRCGKFLDVMLKNADWDRKDIYIANTVKGRPYERNGKYKKNRPPSNIEVNACKRWLWEEIQLVEPKVIMTLGAIPTRLLLDLPEKQPLKTVIGLPMVVEYSSATILPEYHPSYICSYAPGRQYNFEKTLRKAKEIIDGR